MPQAEEDALKRVAHKLAKQGKLKRKKGDSLSQAVDRFTYGVMRRRGWKPSREKK